MPEARPARSPTITAIDCHAHVMRRDAPLAPDRHSAPKRDCTVDEYLGVLDANGISHGVLTAPSFYGTDNSLLLDALDRAAGAAARDRHRRSRTSTAQRSRRWATRRRRHPAQLGPPRYAARCCEPPTIGSFSRTCAISTGMSRSTSKGRSSRRCCRRFATAASRSSSIISASRSGARRRMRRLPGGARRRARRRHVRQAVRAVSPGRRRSAALRRRAARRRRPAATGLGERLAVRLARGRDHAIAHCVRWLADWIPDDATRRIMLVDTPAAPVRLRPAAAQHRADTQQTEEASP